MPKAIKVKYIVIHCSAGYGNVKSILNYFKNTLKWKNPGYHIIIDLNGKKHYVHDFDKIANGVRGYNHECLHISYIGGVQKDNYSVAKDTRTLFQKQSILECVIEMVQWLQDNGKKDLDTNLMVLGHRDFSPDKNLNGMIDKNERIKECPSFNVIPEFSWIGATNLVQLLPFNRKK